MGGVNSKEKVLMYVYPYFGVDIECQKYVDFRST